MINDYKKTVDRITASEQLKNTTIMKLKNKKSENSHISRKRRIYPYKLSAAVLCIFIAVSGAVTLYKGNFVQSSKMFIRNNDINTEVAETNKDTEDKKIMAYAPDSVQARIMTEEAVSMDKSAMVDRLAPKSKNIKERYANSQNVIKGYVYSTEYFWNINSVANQLYTKSVITIEKSYKGALKPGEKVTIIEHGGVTTLKDWIEKTSVKEYKDFEKEPEKFDPYQGKLPNTLVDYAGFFGIKPMRTGQEVVLFLVPDSYAAFGKNGTPGYRLVEGDGGKMVLEKGIYKTKIAPDDVKGFIKNESCAESDIDNLIKAAADSSK